MSVSTVVPLPEKGLTEALDSTAGRSDTRDDTTLVKPQAHVFTRYKLPRTTLPTDVPMFEEFSDREKVYPKESFESWTELVNKYG
jgi:hypothetical protein